LTTRLLAEDAMNEALAPHLEEQAQRFADQLHQATHEDCLRIARLLVAADSPFDPDTEFRLRDQVLGIGARALQLRLAEKKTAAPTAPA
jgi:hypothetical protein